MSANWTQYISATKQVKIEAHTQPQPVESYTLTLSPAMFKELRMHFMGMSVRGTPLEELVQGLMGMQQP
jgi:hypothetical protein